MKRRVNLSTVIQNSLYQKFDLYIKIHYGNIIKKKKNEV